MVTQRKRKSKKSAAKPRAAQPTPVRRQCGAMAAHFRLLEQDAGFRSRQASLERATSRAMATEGRALTRAAKPPTVIPVVVHVVYNLPSENISLAQIKSQITVLNRDFRAKNPDKVKTPAPFKGLVADSNVEFALATKDPQGKPTNGVTRTKTTRTSFGTNDSVKFKGSGGADAWPTDRYLNIWACSLGG